MDSGSALGDRAAGRRWFVLSGHYAADGSIYYAKYVFSSDLRTLAGFEITYPVPEKSRMDPIVEHLEESFHGPQ